MKLRVGQPVVFKGRIGTIWRVGEKMRDIETGKKYRWLQVRDDLGVHVAPSDHPELVIQ